MDGGRAGRTGLGMGWTHLAAALAVTDDPLSRPGTDSRTGTRPSPAGRAVTHLSTTKSRASILLPFSRTANVKAGPNGDFTRMAFMPVVI